MARQKTKSVEDIVKECDARINAEQPTAHVVFSVEDYKALREAALPSLRCNICHRPVA